MRKIMISLAVIMTLMFPLTAHASTARSNTIILRLSFSGTTATCSVTITSDSTNDEIEAAIKLWQGSTCVATWQESGSGYIIFKDTTTVIKGKTYELTVDVTINGVAQTQASTSGKCS